MQIGDERHANIDNATGIMEGSLALTPTAEHAEDTQEEIVRTEEDAGDAADRIHLQPLPLEKAHSPPSQNIFPAATARTASTGICRWRSSCHFPALNLPFQIIRTFF